MCVKRRFHYLSSQLVLAELSSHQSNYVTALEFMVAVRIRRTKFNELIAGS